MPIDLLIQLLRQCCVRIRGDGKGSGFFVGPGLVITCAHVVGQSRSVNSGGIEVSWTGHTDRDARVVDIAPADDDDLALLRVTFRDHPCVSLDDAVAIDDPVYAIGYPVYGTQQLGEGLSGKHESLSELESGDRFLLKFKDALVIPGFSGGPLLNRRTARVIGVVTETRGGQAAVGGRAIPSALVQERFAAVREAQKADTIHLSAWLDVVDRLRPSRASRLSGQSAPPAETPNHNVQAFERLDAFIGRDAHVRRVLDLLQERRLVTVHGCGGCGKTRLAIEVARRSLKAFRDGVWIVDLVQVEAPDLLAKALADTLDLQLPREEDEDIAVIAAIGQRELLLVFDNCEHLVDGQSIAPFVESLLRGCPRVRVLATSRMLLGLSEFEQRYPLPPLEVPPDDAILSDALEERFDAIELFVRRATLRDPEFSLAGENARHAVALCRQLGGLPLAIEIAAARLDLTPLSALVGEMRDALHWVDETQERRDHATVQGVIEWSYNRLSPDLQRVLRSLTVFVGGFSHKAAAALHADADPQAVARWLRDLRETSLLMRRESMGQYRFRILEPVVQFADKLLVDTERAGWMARAGTWFYGLADQAAPHLVGRDGEAWIRRLDEDHPSLRRVVAWLTAHDRERALQLGAQLWRFWEIRGFLEEGQDRLEAMLQDVPDDPATPDVGECLSGAGLLAYRRGFSKPALEHFERALAFERARPDNAARLANCLNDVGIAAQVRGDLARARDVYEEAMGMAEAIDARRTQGTLAFNLGNLAWQTGRFEDANTHLDRAYQLFDDGGFKRDRAFPLYGKGMVALLTERLDEAVGLFQQSHRLRTEAEDRRGMADCLIGLGRAAVLQGDLETAQRNLRDAAALHAEVASRRGLAECLEAFALLYERLEEGAKGVEMSEAAAGHRERFEIPRPPAVASVQDALLVRLERQLGKDRVAVARRAGRRRRTVELLREMT